MTTAIAFGLLLVTAFGLTRIRPLSRASIGWHGLIGGTALLHALILFFQVTTFVEMVLLGITFLLWLILWMFTIAGLPREKRGGNLGLLFFYPLAYIAIALVAPSLTGPQIATAQLRGGKLLDRAQAYKDEHWEYPTSLQALKEFDGLAIPESGVGLWGHQEFHYANRAENEDQPYITFGGFMGARQLLWLEEELWWLDLTL